MKTWSVRIVVGGLVLLTVGWLLSMRVTPGSGEENPGAGAYRDITSFAAESPAWLQKLAEIGTEAGILVCLALAVIACWRARSEHHRKMAAALLVPVATGVAYVLSELVKSGIEEERPCRAVARAHPIAECPELGDWSFPSNHSVIVAGLMAALFLVWRAGAWLALPIAVLTAFSRVYLGVHYLHDVVAGFLVGAVVAPVVLRLLIRPGELIVARLRAVDVLRPVLTASGPAGASTAAHAADTRTVRAPAHSTHTENTHTEDTHTGNTRAEGTRP
ncbi:MULTISPECIES: phosphatase PAP2 family protein [Streptomyces violaceusniger group]|uniref:phosphatase PAP2 family protein n=1 Tax=Streptomyces violaceusniger group TaxID=2839105 RepID=UPI001FC9D17C|nr:MULTISPECIES: phosphatase PAP2 family protein [Streptomyces violaceusniger group]